MMKDGNDTRKLLAIVEALYQHALIQNSYIPKKSMKRRIANLSEGQQRIGELIFRLCFRQRDLSKKFEQVVVERNKLREMKQAFERIAHLLK